MNADSPLPRCKPLALPRPIGAVLSEVLARYGLGDDNDDGASAESKGIETTRCGIAM